MIRIKIYGRLAKDIGVKEVDADCGCVADVFAHLSHITGGEFPRALIKNKNGGIPYIHVVGEGQIPVNGREALPNDCVIRFMPAMALSGPAAFVALGASSYWAGVLSSITISLALSAAFALLSMLLAPSPPQIMDGGPETKRKEAYLFDGRARTVNQGSCVPIGYGRMIVPGSVVYNRVEYVEI